jgi:hypothetical protein
MLLLDFVEVCSTTSSAGNSALGSDSVAQYERLGADDHE